MSKRHFKEKGIMIKVYKGNKKQDEVNKSLLSLSLLSAMTLLF